MKRVWLLALLIVASEAGGAEVQVDVLHNRFQPEVVEVEPGDTVTWTVERGRHRLLAEEAAALPAFGSPVLGGGDQYRYTFSTPGDFHYFSDGGEGMTGAVSVRVTPARFPAGVELSAAWYDPAAPGQGMLFEYVPSSNTLVVLWFTFRPSGGEQLWLIGTGQPDAGRVTMEMLRTEGGRLDDPRPVARIPWGELSLDFSDCNNAVARFNAAEDGRSGRIALSRLYLADLCTGG